MAKRTNHAYEKRQRDLAKQRKRKEKAERKRLRRDGDEDGAQNTGNADEDGTDERRDGAPPVEPPGDSRPEPD